MPTKKKTKKKAKSKEEIFEDQLNNIDKSLEIVERISEEEKIRQKEEKKRIKEFEKKIETIRKDLKEQLLSQNKFDKQFEDMIEDYIFFVKLKEDLQYDIKCNGLRYRTMTGNGYPADKPNESVQNLVKINAQMLKILQDLELKTPDDGPKEGEGDDLLQ